MHVFHDVTELRLQLFNNGYSPIPNRDKRTFMKGWPKLTIDEDEIRKWGRRTRDTATGLRLEKGLAVIDIDVNIPEVVDAVTKAIADACPDAFELGLIRFGKGVKQAWFVRTAEAFGRISTHRFVEPGAGPDADAHCVEIFGGAMPRQFGAFGPHTITDDGTVKVWYRWGENGDPSTVPLADLPVLTKKQFFAVADAAEKAMRAAGLEQVLRSTSGEGEATRVYDLVPTMKFDCNDGVRRSLDQLRTHLASTDHVRCSARWTGDENAKRLDRCLVSIDRAGGVAIWETQSGVSHREASLKPVDTSVDMDLAREKLQIEAEMRNRLSTKDDVAETAVGLEAEIRIRLSHDDSVFDTAVKLEKLYVFQPDEPKKAVVKIGARDINAGKPMSAFRDEMAPYGRDLITGPRGGVTFVNPADLWRKSARRVDVAGLRLRPDMPRPTYEEDGETWLNIYRPPLHDAPGGDASIGWEFMTHLLPDAREREWFLRWLAYKVRHPAMPGPAVIMVARDQGTGRGTLFKLLRKVFGNDYVKSVAFQTFAGQDGQAQYTDWGAGALMVTVNESSGIGPGSYSNKHNTYERLKEIVDPSVMEKHIVRKGLSNYHALSFASYIIASNNRDALPIPESDRRFAVLSNGEKAPQALMDRVHAWIDHDVAGVAAFVRELRALDLGDYSPTKPPIMTEAKATMTEMGRSDLDRAFELAMANIHGEVFAASQVVNLMRTAMQEFDFEPPAKWPAMVKNTMLPNTSYRLGVRHSANYYTKVKGQRHAVFARTQPAAKKWAGETHENLLAELEKNGSLSQGNVVSALFRANNI